MKESLLLLRNYNKASCIVGFGPSFAASTPQGRSQPRVAAAVVSRPAMPTVFIDLADVKNNHLIRGRSLEAVQSQNASFARLRHPCCMCGRVRRESRKVAICPLQTSARPRRITGCTAAPIPPCPPSRHIHNGSGERHVHSRRIFAADARAHHGRTTTSGAAAGIG